MLIGCDCFNHENSGDDDALGEEEEDDDEEEDEPTVVVAVEIGRDCSVARVCVCDGNGGFNCDCDRS